MPKIFLITGVTSGFGRAFAEAAAADGHKVFGTIRREDARAEFEAIAPGNTKAVLLDVSDFAAIPAAIAKIEQDAGTIDVLVNNAGYGFEGTLEESSIDDLKRQFDVNVFGAVAMMQAVLPGMRKQRSGHIINITSMGGFATFPGVSFYCGSKAALESISETLAKEVESLGIAVTAIAPGGFRTDWAGRSMIRAPRSIPDYDAIFDPVRAARQARSGKQAGDPAKAAQALLKLVAMEKPPRHLLLGNDAVNLVRQKIGELTAEFDAHEELSRSTDF